MTLNEHEATCKKENKETENKQEIPFPQIGWNDPKNTGRLNYPRKAIKPGPVIGWLSLEPLVLISQHGFEQSDFVTVNKHEATYRNG